MEYGPAMSIYFSHLSIFLYIRAFSQLGKCKEALDFATAAQQLNPSDADIVAKVESIKRDLQAGL